MGVDRRQLNEISAKYRATGIGGGRKAQRVTFKACGGVNAARIRKLMAR